MKLTTVLIIVTLLQVSAASLAQKVTYKNKQATLEQVFQEIRKQTGYNVLIAADNLKDDAPQVVDFKNASLDDVLKQVLENRSLTYTIEEKSILIKEKKPSLLDKIESALALPVTVTGKITDTTGTPLQGATIAVKGKNLAVSSNVDGNFTISAQPGDQLVISFLGFVSRTINVTESLPFQAIVLHSTYSKLNEVAVVSTGYQKLSKSRTTGAFVQLDSATINRRVSTDVLSRLEGVTPGLLFNRNTQTNANGTLDLSIRGHSTLFANDQPLVVVDNFPYDGDINNINPNDIESITVLKDAAAASIWGVRSGNGVIVINTKKGGVNQPMTIDFNANVTVGQKPDAFYNPAFLDANDFINIEQTLFNMGYYNSALTSVSHSVVSPVVQLLANQRAGIITAAQANTQINSLRNNDVRNDIEKYLYQKSVNQQYNLNLSGGSATNTYYFSTGFDNNLSNLVGNNSNRFTLNGQNTFRPLKNVEISLGYSYVENHNTNNALTNLNSGGAYGTIYPYAKLADDNGNALPIAKDYAYSWITDPNAQKGLLDWQYKPLDEIRNADNTSIAKDSRINAGIRYSFLNDFSAEIKYQYETTNSNTKNYYSTNTYYARNLINEYTSISGTTVTNNIPNAGILQYFGSDLSSNRIRGQLNFAHSWSKHKVSALIGSEVNQTVTDGQSNTTYGYDDNLGTYQLVNFTNSYNLYPSGSALIPGNFGFSKFTDRYISYYSNANYSFLDRYLFSISGRIDRSNLFGVSTNQKAVPLYSTGFAWDINKESFYHLGLLPLLKIRATFGYNGNIDKNLTAVTTLVQNSGAYFSNDPYASIANSGNPSLRWEKDQMINLATDFGFKKGVVTGSFDFYFKKGIDLIGDAPLAPSTGVPTFRGNTASTKGNGFDLVLNSKNIDTKNFQWTSNLLVSHVLDKVTGYALTQTTANALVYGYGNSGTVLPIVGQPIFAIYSFAWAGLTHDTGDPQGYLSGKVSTDYTNIIKNTTLNDLVYNGPSRPTVFGSFRNTFVYKRLSASINIIYKLNYYFRKSTISYNALYAGWSGHSDFTKRWQNPGDELITNVPSIQYPPVNTNRDYFYSNSSVLVDRGDHIRLQDASLGYDFDKGNWKGIPFKHIQLYCYLNNIGILWRANKDKLDPDLFGYSGAYPSPRTISFGIKTNL